MGAVDRAVAFTEEHTVDARGKSQSREHYAIARPLM